MRNNIPYRDSAGGGNNPGIAELLVSPWMRSVMFEAAEVAQAVYQEIVAKRTGRLARSARIETYIGGHRNDRWCSRLIVGGSTAPHGPPHEYGYDDGDTDIRAGAHDLNQVLNLMGQL